MKPQAGVVLRDPPKDGLVLGRVVHADATDDADLLDHEQYGYEDGADDLEAIGQLEVQARTTRVASSSALSARIGLLCGLHGRSAGSLDGRLRTGLADL